MNSERYIQIFNSSVVFGKVSGWVGKFLAKTSSLRLGWGIEWNFG